MAEARAEEEPEQEALRTEHREHMHRRQSAPSGGRPDRRKPEHRLSQGPLSSIRAAIKRTSTRTTSESERERERERRRPQITILSAEPLASTSWFSGTSAGFPPPPPPAAQIWGPTIPPTVRPPPSYEEVIREKNQEVTVLPSPSPSRPVSTIATQTDTGAPIRSSDPPVSRPLRPPRPPYPAPPRSSDDITTSQSAPDSLDSALAYATGSVDLFSDLHPASPDQSSPVPLERPRPRPRSKLQPISSEVKVQTLVKLRDDGEATLAAAALAGGAKRDSSGGVYLRELLDAFSSDDWGFPDRRSDSSGLSQSESEEEAEDAENMAALRARIQAFEQRDASVEQSDAKPEPRPRPRLQGQPAKPRPPAVAPKPKNVPPLPKPSSKGFWEGMDEPASAGVNAKQETVENAVAPPTLETPVPAPRPPPRPSLAPRPLDRGDANRSDANRLTSLTPPTKPQVDVCADAATENGNNCSVRATTFRPDVPNKPAMLTAQRRASAPPLSPQPIGTSPVPADDLASVKLVAPVKPPAPTSRKRPLTPSRSVAMASPDVSEPPLPPRPSGVKLLPLRPPPIKSSPGRPPPPAVSSASQGAPSVKAPPFSQLVASETANQRAPKRGPPLPPRPKPGHPLYSMKQEVLIVLDEPSPAPSEQLPVEGRPQTTETPLIVQSESLLDVDLQRDSGSDQDGQSKHSMDDDITLSDSQTILPVEQKQLHELPVSGPRCIAAFDYEGEEDDELTFCQGDVIALLELIGQEWGRGQIHGRVGVFPLSFTEILEPLPLIADAAPTNSSPSSGSDLFGKIAAKGSEDEWAVALYDFAGQTVDDLSFHKGALIRVTERVDAEWRRGQLDGREGLYPAAFTQPCQPRPMTEQQTATKGSAKVLFDFTAENEDELTLKVGDIITEVESVDEQWILGVVGGRRGIVPKNFVSPL